MTTLIRKSALVLGAISRDLLVTDRAAPEPRPGGGVYHGGLALVRLGLSVRVVTRVRPDDEDALLSSLRAERVDVLALPSDMTTTYLNDYRAGTDQHDLQAASDPIRPEDVPADWTQADLVQLSPLHQNDIVPETAARLHGSKGLDVQGLFRKPEAAGLRALPSFLAHLDVLQASESDLPALRNGDSLERFVRRFNVREMIVTRGSRGATIITGKGPSEIRTRPIKGGNPVGAGDVFLASYLFLRVSDRGPIDAARGAARACSAKIEHGSIPTGFNPEQEDA